MLERSVFVGQRMYAVVRFRSEDATTLFLARGYVADLEGDSVQLRDIEAVEDPYTPQSTRDWRDLPLENVRLNRGVLGHTIKGARLRGLLVNHLHAAFEKEKEFEACKRLVLSMADALLERAKGRKLDYIVLDVVREMRKLTRVTERVWKAALPRVLERVVSGGHST